MKRSWMLVVAIAFAATLLVANFSAAAVDIGDAGPGFSGVGVDDKERDLADYSKAKEFLENAGIDLDGGVAKLVKTTSEGEAPAAQEATTA